MITRVELTTHNYPMTVLPGRKSPNGNNYIPLILQLLLQTFRKIGSSDLNVQFVRSNSLEMTQKVCLILASGGNA